MTFEDLCSKYDIVIVDGHRFYNINLNERRYDLENTAPFKFSYRNRFEIYSNNWNNLFVELVKRLENFDSKTKEEYLNFTVDWSKQSIFSNNLTVNCSFFEEKVLYINTNLTSLHFVWLLQDFLRFHNVDINECQLLIRRFQIAEPSEVCRFIIDDNKNKFVKYLERVYKFEEDYAIKICNTIDAINKNFVPLINSAAVRNLFLFDNLKSYQSAKPKIIQKIKERYSERNLEIALMCLDYLTKYYSLQNKVKKDISNSI